jgi:hypothetical protein
MDWIEVRCEVDMQPTLQTSEEIREPEPIACG